MSFNRTAFNSLHLKLIAGIVLIIAPMVSFLIYNNFYSMEVVRNQVAQSNSNMLNLYMGIIDNKLSDIDQYLLKFAAEETGLIALERSSESDIDAYNLERIWLFSKLRDNTIYYNGLDYFFVYSPANDDLLFAPKVAGSADSDNEPIQKAIAGLVRDTANSANANLSYDRWAVLPMQQDYLVHIVKSGGLYIGAGVNANEVMGPLDLLDLGAEGRALLVDGAHAPVQDKAFINEHKIDLTFPSDTYRLTGDKQQYLVIGKDSSVGEFGLAAVVPDHSILERLPYLQRIILFMAIGSILILLAAFYFLRRVVLLPIRRIVSAMRKIKEGYLEARIPDRPTSNEFELMNQTFNSMVSELQQLKIHVYEEQLNSQRAELKQLQLQINPHFFLNSLNVVYYMAQEKNYDLIQELSLSLIRYFRLMFRSQTDYALLKDELSLTENYLKIQGFRFPGNLSYTVTAEKELMDCVIPPLIIQSFAENTIKHAVNTDDPTHIDISLWTTGQPEAAKLHIRIRDTGSGFSEEILSMLNEGMNLTNEGGEHIGIWNVRRRLRLLYRAEAAIAFSNDRGAVIDMILPLLREAG
ncbi:sensor histidine kinase [Paenibacillus glycanilyticus]|uniref:Sensor histidine kinase n=1 Tax=Paenibacillus glycanilyticus TaxID=126569 RepID=A0ABQ6GMV2_9BACL|nr:histidine kinase [Paenibacillus glycanilyticus]GLX71410.1 sensor histidine kinase [Paenibacillus glycanilyticus]